MIQFLLLQRYALFSDIPSIEPVKLRAVKINTPLLMQSDISFILDLYLPIVACTCDISTLANITGLLIESQCLSRKKLSVLHTGAKQRIRYSLPGCHSSQHVLLSLSLGCLPFCHHVESVAGNSVLQQHASQAERHTQSLFIPNIQQCQKWFSSWAIFHGSSSL